MTDLNDIALFVQVVRHGSFAEAGRRLDIPSNTVSRRIQELETRLGVQLMQRSTRRLALTEAGRAFHDRCVTAVDDLEQASRDLAEGSGTPRGLVRVATDPGFFDSYPMDRIKAFLDSHPQMRLEFVLDDLAIDLVSAGIDVAIRSTEAGATGFARHLMTIPATGLVASPAYLAACGTPAEIRDLHGHDCVAASQPGGRAVWSLVGPGDVEHDVEVSGRFVVNTERALHQAALAGLGIALLANTPATLANITAGRLVPVLPDYRRPDLKMTLVFPSRNRPSLAVSAFVESVREWARRDFAQIWNASQAATRPKPRLVSGQKPIKATA